MRRVKFKLDENLPELVRETLQELGFDAHTVAQESLAGDADEDVLRRASTRTVSLSRSISTSLTFGPTRPVRIAASGCFVLRSKRFALWTKLCAGPSAWPPSKGSPDSCGSSTNSGCASGTVIPTDPLLAASQYRRWMT